MIALISGDQLAGATVTAHAVCRHRSSGPSLRPTHRPRSAAAALTERMPPTT